jgi:hypothetical protein
MNKTLIHVVRLQHTVLFPLEINQMHITYSGGLNLASRNVIFQNSHFKAIQTVLETHSKDQIETCRVQTTFLFPDEDLLKESFKEIEIKDKYICRQKDRQRERRRQSPPIMQDV